MTRGSRTRPALAAATLVAALLLTAPAPASAQDENCLRKSAAIVKATGSHPHWRHPSRGPGDEFDGFVATSRFNLRLDLATISHPAPDGQWFVDWGDGTVTALGPGRDRCPDGNEVPLDTTVEHGYDTRDREEIWDVNLFHCRARADEICRNGYERATDPEKRVCAHGDECQAYKFHQSRSDGGNLIDGYRIHLGPCTHDGDGRLLGSAEDCEEMPGPGPAVLRECKAPRYEPDTLQRTVKGLGWWMVAKISEDDGLTLEHVKLGDRYMARKISLPYFEYAGLAEGGGPTDVVLGGGELAHGSEQGASRTRLLGWGVDRLGGAFAVTARWVVDGLAFTPDPESCIYVEQRYEFHQRVPGDHCEPTGLVPCARFMPKVSYSYTGRRRGPGSLVAFTAPQRLHFMADAGHYAHEFNAGALAEDHDDFGAAAGAALLDVIPALGDASPDLDSLWGAVNRIASAAVIKRQVNPVPKERAEHVIREGAIAPGGERWDNYHQTRSQAVQMPRGFALERVLDFQLPWPKPGCPECVHVHWRWGKTTDPSAPPSSILFPGFGDHNGGAARIPRRSRQDVRVGMVKYSAAVRGERGEALRAFEEDPVPRGWESLVNGQSFDTQKRAKPNTVRRDDQHNQIALWYEGTGFGPSDLFFEHGGFFAYDRPGAPGFRSKPSVRNGKEGEVLLRYDLSEWATVKAFVERFLDRRGNTIAYETYDGEGDTEPRDLLIAPKGGRSRLPAGRYRATVTGTDLSGRRTRRPATVEFRVNAKGEVAAD